MRVGEDLSASDVSIVIPVFNALRETIDCLNSVIEYSTGSYHLILVNDASDRETSQYLIDFSKRHPSVELLENAENRGFCRVQIVPFNLRSLFFALCCAFK